MFSDFDPQAYVSVGVKKKPIRVNNAM